MRLAQTRVFFVREAEAEEVFESNFSSAIARPWRRAERMNSRACSEVSRGFWREVVNERPFADREPNSSALVEPAQASDSGRDWKMVSVVRMAI